MNVFVVFPFLPNQFSWNFLHRSLGLHFCLLFAVHHCTFHWQLGCTFEMLSKGFCNICIFCNKFHWEKFFHFPKHHWGILLGSVLSCWKVNSILLHSQFPIYDQFNSVTSCWIFQISKAFSPSSFCAVMLLMIHIIKYRNFHQLFCIKYQFSWKINVFPDQDFRKSGSEINFHEFFCFRCFFVVS